MKTHEKDMKRKDWSWTNGQQRRREREKARGKVQQGRADSGGASEQRVSETLWGAEVMGCFVFSSHACPCNPGKPFSPIYQGFRCGMQMAAAGRLRVL